MYKENNSTFFKETLDKINNLVKDEKAPVINLGNLLHDQPGSEYGEVDVNQLMNDTINKANAVYQANHNQKDDEQQRLNEFDSIVGTAAYSAYALNVMCARDSFINKIDAFLDDPENEYFLEDNGITFKDKEAFRKELKDYTLEALKTGEKTAPLADFIAEVDEHIKASNQPNPRESFINSMGAYIATINHTLDNMSQDLSAETNKFKGILFPQRLLSSATVEADKIDYGIGNTIRNHTTVGMDREMNNNYDGLDNNPFVEDICKDLGVMLESQNISILYGDTVHPTDFLDHYNEGTISEAESEWARKQFDDITYRLAEKFNRQDPNHHQMVDINCFYANGRQIVSDDDMAAAGKSEDKMRELEQKVIAAMLSGENITVKSADKSMQTTLNPMVEPPKKAEFKFGQILQWIYELFVPSKKKEIEKVNAMNEKFEKNALSSEVSRVKMNFNELANNNTLNNNNQTHRPAQREKTNAMNGPQK